MKTLTIRRPDDWHVHLRDGAMLKAVLPFTSKVFGRAIVMPNLSPLPVITTKDLREYRARIEAALPPGSVFKPLMTYYLTDNSSPEDIASGFKEGIASAVKLYPAGATTNSQKGVTDIRKVYPVLQTLEKIGMPILIHGERLMSPNGETIPAPDREKVFLETTLPQILKDFSGLKIVLEHATTKNLIDFVRNEKSERLASTITVHHLTQNNADVEASEEPAYLACMPVIKNEADQRALREAATSGEPYFFLGTDSAPHPVSAKEKMPPAAGIFTAPLALPLYAGVFEEMEKLENLEAFASLNGPRFYGMEPNADTITLEKNPWTIDSLVEVGEGEQLRPFGYTEDPLKRLNINWKLA
jgi:dihydroorotase